MFPLLFISARNAPQNAVCVSRSSPACIQSMSRTMRGFVYWDWDTGRGAALRGRRLIAEVAARVSISGMYAPRRREKGSEERKKRSS
jgi:hypothetical protein